MKSFVFLFVLIALGQSNASKLSALRQYIFKGYDKLVNIFFNRLL